MALQCNLTVSSGSVTAGQPSQATLTVYNPNASAVVVTGCSVFVTTLDGQYATAANSPSVALGPGTTTSVPTLSSITFGPFPIVVGSAAAASPFDVINQGTNIFPLNPQPSQRPQQRYLVQGLVYASDGSVNTSGVAPLLVSYTLPPPMNLQGGPLMFSAPNNLALGFVSGVL